MGLHVSEKAADWLEHHTYRLPEIQDAIHKLLRPIPGLLFLPVLSFPAGGS